METTQHKPYNKVEIIVILYRAPELERQCLKSVLEHTTEYTLTVYDNYPTNMNIAALWNSLINRSEAEYICLLNSDTLVEEGWITGLLRGFTASPDVRVVGPSTNNCHSKQNQGRGKGTEIVDELSGFCILFPKAHWQQIGGFDETYPFYGQESDFNRRTRQTGFQLCWVKDVFVWHYGSGSAKLAEQRGELNVAAERKKGIAKYWGKEE